MPLLIVCLLFLTNLSAQVVINEVCYDPDGADAGKEWIELYNTGSADVDLQGAKIFSGGGSFVLVYDIPHFILRSHRFLLIGEAQVTSAAFITELGFQNGGSETDGVRYVGPDGISTDTVLYDSPNLNGLQDDTGAVGTSLAPDVSEGYSLARVTDGYDTDHCAVDFLAETDPTPGISNRVYLDLSLSNPLLWLMDGSYHFSIWVKNIGATPVPTSGTLSILLDGNQIDFDVITELVSGDSLQFEYAIMEDDGQEHILQAVLEAEGDVDTGNNTLTVNIGMSPPSSPVLNEVMFDPLTGKQEWIEVLIDTSETRGDFSIRDAAGNDFSFTLPPQVGFYVLCADAEQMLMDYPLCPGVSVIETTGWATLNNTGDTIYLLDSEDVVLDSLIYTGTASQQGKSLERHQVSEHGFIWRYSLDASGSTPGRINSSTPPIPDFDGTLCLQGSPCKARAGESISLFYKLSDQQSRASCRIFDRAGHRVRILGEGLSIPSEGSLTWDGRDSNGKYVPRGLYYLLWESQPGNGGKIYRRQLSLVIYD
jgi:hypothetical protein